MDSSSKILNGKTAFITGCNRGIGKALVELFAQNGANIIACTRKKTDDFDDYIKKISKDNQVAISNLTFDLQKEEEIRDAMKSLYKNKTSVDILVNNAGVASGGSLHMTSMQTLRDVFEINFFSQVLLTQYVTKLMMKAKKGSVINLASITGIDGIAGYTSYGSAKSALIYFTKTIAKELAAYNIRVNAIAPGVINTDMAGLMDTKVSNEMVGNSAFNRLGTPEEIAQLALFLASDNSSYITGQVIRIDGGI